MNDEQSKVLTADKAEWTRKMHAAKAAKKRECALREARFYFRKKYSAWLVCKNEATERAHAYRDAFFALLPEDVAITAWDAWEYADSHARHARIDMWYALHWLKATEKGGAV